MWYGLDAVGHMRDNFASERAQGLVMPWDASQRGGKHAKAMKPVYLCLCV